MNLYSQKDSKIGYIITCEKIFCLVRGLILSVIYILKIKLKLSLYLLLIGIFLLSFQYKKTTSKI